MMTTDEPKIWEAAVLPVRRRRGGGALTGAVWCWIARSTAELLRPAPGAGERVH